MGVLRPPMTGVRRGEWGGVGAFPRSVPSSEPNAGGISVSYMSIGNGLSGLHPTWNPVILPLLIVGPAVVAIVGLLHTYRGRGRA